jgi:hypothetical protein
MFSMVSCYKVSRYQGTLFDKFQCFTPTEHCMIFITVNIHLYLRYTCLFINVLSGEFIFLSFKQVSQNCSSLPPVGGSTLLVFVCV